MDYILIFLRSILSLILLFLVTKIIGKKQVSQFSLFDYVIGISIGNFAAEMTINLEIDFFNGFIAIIVYGIMAYLVSIITMKSIVLRRFFMGTPTILVEKGKIIKKNLIKTKIDINDLLEQCRCEGFFDISEIDYAVLEANGKISVLPKNENRPITLKDMKIKGTTTTICANIIIDGKIMKNNLINMKKDIHWLEKELKIRGLKLEKVLLATLDDNEKINFYLNEDITPMNILE